MEAKKKRSRKIRSKISFLIQPQKTLDFYLKIWRRPEGTTPLTGDAAGFYEEFHSGQEFYE
jgi:hypothetical protein